MNFNKKFKLNEANLKNKLTLIGFLSVIPLFLTLEIVYILMSLFNQTTRGKYILDKLTFNKFADEEISKQVEVWKESLQEVNNEK